MIANSTPDVQTSLAELRALTGFRFAQEASLYQTVIAARARGATWDQVAEALGVTRQAAWERFKPACQANRR